MLELLNLGSYEKLMIVSAPSGYGKTTLLCQWLAGHSLRYAWLSLDEADNYPIRFLAYLVAAIQQIDPHLGEGILDDIQSVGMASGSIRSLVELALTQLLNDIAYLTDAFLRQLGSFKLHPVVEKTPWFI